MPRVSVIVPVRNRRPLVRALLDALAAQTLTDHEVVVVDAGSDDGAPDEAEADAGAGRPVRVLRLGPVPVNEARAAGVAAASAGVLAFTDSDCVPDPGWLAAGVAAVEAGADLAHGPTRPARPPRPLERTTAEDGTSGLFPTCNAFYRRAAFDAAGGFDRAAPGRFGFRPGTVMAHLDWGEDTLLGWSVARSGRVTFVPDATVAHHVFPVDRREAVVRAWSVRGFPGLVREVPELRETLLRHRVLLGGASRVPLYAAVAASLAGRRRLAAAAAVAWVGARAVALGRHGTGRGLAVRALPADLAADAVAAAALVSGSVRARTPVL